MFVVFLSSCLAVPPPCLARREIATVSLLSFTLDFSERANHCLSTPAHLLYSETVVAFSHIFASVAQLSELFFVFYIFSDSCLYTCPSGTDQVLAYHLSR